LARPRRPPGLPARPPALGHQRRARPDPRRRRDDGRGRLRHPRRTRVALPPSGRGGRAPPAAARAGLRPRAGPAGRALRPCARPRRRHSPRAGELVAPERPMPSFAGVHHVDLVVSSIERSLPFYRDLLAPLGYHRITEVEGERGESIWYLGGPDVLLGLREAQSEGVHDRYRVGIHHLAFEAWSRG